MGASTVFTFAHNPSLAPADMRLYFSSPLRPMYHLPLYLEASPHESRAPHTQAHQHTATCPRFARGACSSFTEDCWSMFHYCRLSFLERAPKLRTFEASFYYRPAVPNELLPAPLRAMPLLASLRLDSQPPAIFGAVPWTDLNIKTFVLDTVTSRWEVKSTAAQLLDLELLIDHCKPILDDQISACVSRLEEQGMWIHVLKSPSHHRTSLTRSIVKIHPGSESK
ncbi:hypothetical protein B0H16DRAFT_1692130 [Mycena metata]|uniref:Uncharacterized protein n=1 Tax=Mycena metata TaxID=1033252 RepID=A0AAD7N656_9AGAR|nr:hypothetical protein B0H16DRAFT_1692130 [Mycena metata]